MILFDCRPTWEWLLVSVFYAFQNALCFLINFVLAISGQKQSVKISWMGFTIANVVLLAVAAIGYCSEQNIREGIAAWLEIPKNIAFFVGMTFFEERAVFVLYIHCILEAGLLLVSDAVLYAPRLSVILENMGTSVSSCYFVFATIIVIFRKRALFRARRVMMVDQVKYEFCWNNLLGNASTMQTLDALQSLVEAIVSKRPFSVAQQFNRLCTEHTSSQRYAEMQSARASFSLKARSARRRRSYLGMTGVPGSIDYRSPVDSLDQLYVQAMCLNPILINMILGWANASKGLLPRTLPGGHTSFVQHTEGHNVLFNHIKWCKIKSVDRAIEKALRIYGQVTDLQNC